MNVKLELFSLKIKCDPKMNVETKGSKRVLWRTIISPFNLAYSNLLIIGDSDGKVSWREYETL